VLVIAYVFWHWKKPDSTRDDYESRQQAFHAALESSPPAGFVRSFSVSLAGVPWIPAGAEPYEDWYLVEDFGALAPLNEGAVTGRRSGPHDAAAAVAAGGTAGIYALRCGMELVPAFAQWFEKPAGMPYKECLDGLAPLVDKAGGALWMRQLTLGPARELCIHSRAPVKLPPAFAVLEVPLQKIWPIRP
jgi:hypothetical protein